MRITVQWEYPELGGVKAATPPSHPPIPEIITVNPNESEYLNKMEGKIVLPEGGIAPWQTIIQRSKNNCSAR
jgi:hypothetical protein